MKLLKEETYNKFLETEKKNEELVKQIETLNSFFEKFNEIKDELKSAVEKDEHLDSPEMFGFYNGVGFTISMAETGVPTYLPRPDYFFEDEPTSEPETAKKPPMLKIQKKKKK